MKIFYSWQSDTPKEVGKEFIRQALDAAVSGLEINESERPIVDQDTAGVLGSPIIAETIFRKIREASVIVVDVSLTGKTASNKPLINSNVAIELGYAIGVHGDEVLLKVMNIHYGSARNLPFDLIHRRWPVRFALPPNAADPQRQQVLAELAGELRNILEAYVQAHRVPPELFAPTASTTNPAAFWQSQDVLVQHGDASLGDTVVTYGLRADLPTIYMRIWPHDKIAPLSATILNDQSISVIEPLCGTRSGWSNARNRYGRIAYAWNAENTLDAVTQVFKTGEIWGINHYQLRPRDGYPKMLPMIPFEQGIRGSLSKYLHAGRAAFGYPNKVHVEFGLINVSGFKLALPSNSLPNFSGEIFEDVRLSTVVDMQEEQSGESALSEILRAVYEAAGETRP
jgi:hypothetical protein